MQPLVPLELLGWAAAALTLATFVCRDMLKLRLLALAANMAFISYGLGAGLWPVATLHMALVPVNLCRLMELRRAPPPAPASPAHRRWVPRRRAAPRLPRPRSATGEAPPLPPPGPPRPARMGR